MDSPVCIAFYKPYGVLTAFTDAESRETLKRFIDVPGVYPAGRLDMDSEGLLLLTNDGDLAHRLTDPRFNHPKTYLVQVEGIPSPDALAKLAGGVEVKKQVTRRSQVMVVPEPDLPPRGKPVTPHGPTSWLRMVLREGKKRQIRHMTAAVGLPTLRLVRVAIGPVTINDLQPGEWRYLNPAEILALQEYMRSEHPAGQSGRTTRKPEASRRGEKFIPPAHRPAPGSVTRRGPANRPTKAGEKAAGSPGNARGSRYRNGGRRPPGR